MSFKNPTPERPFNVTIEWKGGDGEWTRWDKDKKENVIYLLDEFIVLEELASISGYCEEDKKGVWSNEVKNTKNEELQVRVGNKIRITGTYQDIKAEAANIGGKYTRVLYALDGDQIIRILITGAALTGYINKGFSPMSQQCGVKFSGMYEEKKGRVVYQVPEFASKKLSAEQVKLAIEKCDVLEAWLSSRDTEKTESETPQLADDRFADVDAANQAFEEQAYEDAKTATDEVPF